MTIRERYHKEEDWRKKIHLTELLHLVQKLRHRTWRVRDTARALGISVGLASENLRIAEAFHQGLNAVSRRDALRKIYAHRNEHRS